MDFEWPPRFRASPLPRPATGWDDAPQRDPAHDAADREPTGGPIRGGAIPLGTVAPPLPSARVTSRERLSRAAPRTSPRTTGLRLPAREPESRLHLEWIVLGFTGYVSGPLRSHMRESELEGRPAVLFAAHDPSEPERVFSRLRKPSCPTEIKPDERRPRRAEQIQKICSRSHFFLYSPGLNGGSAGTVVLVGPRCAGPPPSPDRDRTANLPLSIGPVRWASGAGSR